MVCGVDFAAVDQLTDIASVLEEVVEPSLAEPPSSNHPSAGEASGFGLEAYPVKLLKERTDRAYLQILLKYPTHRLGLVRHDDELLVLVDIAKGDRASHPEPLAPGRGHLVPDPFGDDLAFKLGKGQKHVQRKPPHA